MATRDLRSRRRAGATSRVDGAHHVVSSALGSGLVLLSFAMVLGPLAPLWEGQLLAYVRAAIRGDVSPTTAFVGLLSPVLVMGLFLALLTVWGAKRASGLTDVSKPTARGREDDTMPAPWSLTPLVVPLVVALVAARATHWWVFSLHAAAADPAPLLLALGHALVWVCGGLGVILVVVSLVSLRMTAIRSPPRGSRLR